MTIQSSQPRSNLQFYVFIVILIASFATLGGQGMAKDYKSLDAIVVDEQTVQADDEDDIVQSNIGFINALRAKYYRAAEMNPDAMRSYYVDFYYAQMMNGGFGQLMKNSGWSPFVLGFVEEGMAAMGAARHLDLFRRQKQAAESLGEERLVAFMNVSIYDYGKSPELAVVSRLDDEFFLLEEKENLTQLNRVWLRSRPDLAPISLDAMRAEVERRAAIVPDLAARVAEAEANAPRYVKLIKALAAKSGQKFKTITAGDHMRVFDGKHVLAWYFYTDQGQFHMIDVDGKAMMFRGRSTTDLVLTIDAPE